MHSVYSPLSRSLTAGSTWDYPPTNSAGSQFTPVFLAWLHTEVVRRSPRPSETPVGTYLFGRYSVPSAPTLLVERHTVLFTLSEKLYVSRTHIRVNDKLSTWFRVHWDLYGVLRLACGFTTHALRLQLWNLPTAISCFRNSGISAQFIRWQNKGVKNTI